MIKLTRLSEDDGIEYPLVVVNENSIVSIFDSPKGSVIYFSQYDSICVQESPDEIVGLISK